MVRSVAPGTRMSLAGVAMAGLAVAAGSHILLVVAWVIICAGCAVLIAHGAYAWAAELTLSVGGIAIGLAAAARFSAQDAYAWLGRIGALGLSMGGEQVLGAAAQDSRIQAVVAEGATNRVAGDFAWLSAQYGWRGTVQQALNVPRLLCWTCSPNSPHRPR